MANLSSAAFTLLLSSFWKRHRAQARSEREPSPQPPTAMVAAAAAAAMRGRRAAEELPSSPPFCRRSAEEAAALRDDDALERMTLRAAVRATVFIVNWQIG